ncbi:MAG: hypothetical protein IIB38_01750, partial [Candidatus Hydrogenedentes bacterium]|nr:hypothetical protein [Candidatus Hydrogenedentota bacterium]
MNASSPQRYSPLAMYACKISHAITLITLLALPCYAAPEGDLSYLLDADPGAVTTADLAERAAYFERHYQAEHQVNGITWPRRWDNPEAETPGLYAHGGDNALFTGFYLAAATYRYRVTQDEADLDPILHTLRGLHILTHISGTPGVLARMAFPSDRVDEWNRPVNQYLYSTADLDPDAQPRDVLAPEQPYPPMNFYTRTSRDQLSGVLFGLAVVIGELQDTVPGSTDEHKKIVRAIEIAGEITRALYTRIKGRHFHIRDQEGKAGASSAVTGLLRLQLLAVNRAALRPSGVDARTEREYKRAYRKTLPFGRWGSPADLFNRFNNMTEYYAWNLRFARAYSVWLLEDDPKRKRGMRNYTRKQLWKHVRSHKNTHFTFLYNAMAPEANDRIEAAVYNLKALSLRPVRTWHSPLFGHEDRPHVLRSMFGSVDDWVVPAHLHAPSMNFVWERDPYVVDKYGSPNGVRENTRVDFLLPYWMGRYYG